MNVGFEALPNHADGVANAILRVDQKFVRQERARPRGREGSVMLRAASIARRTSSRSISRGRWPMLTPPRLFTPPHVRASNADHRGFHRNVSKRLPLPRRRGRIELTVESRLTDQAFGRSPFDSAAPKARNFTCSSSISAMSTES